MKETPAAVAQVQANGTVNDAGSEYIAPHLPDNAQLRK
jgi:hypothetical protein